MGRSRLAGVLVVVFAGVVGAALALAVGSWLGEGEPDPAVAASPSATPTPTPEPLRPSPTATPTPSPTIGPVQLAFAGDVHFEDFLRPALLAGPEGLLSATVPLFAGADHVVVNLETAITTRGTPWPKMYNFRAPPEALTALLSAGVDAVSLANNHTLDWREEGFRDTLAHAQAAGMATFGAGVDLASALSPHSVTINGQRIAFIGAAQVLTDEAWVARDATADRPARVGMPGALPHHLDDLLPAVSAAADANDVVVVFLHWGQDYAHCPIAVQTSVAQRLAEAGATIIVGAHAHELQGYGFLDGALVHYGLGNFVWWTRGRGSERSSETGVLHVRIDPDGTMTPEWRPAEITNGVPAPVPADGAAYHARMADWIDCAGF